MTDFTIRALPIPAKRRIEIPDRGGIVGLYLTCHTSGKRTWCVRYRTDGRKSHKRTIGVYPVIGVKRAREEAARALETARLGYASGLTFGQAVAEFRQKHVDVKQRPSTRLYFNRILDRALDRWDGTPLTNITRRHVINMIDEAAAEHGLHEANTTWKVLGKFFRWSENRDYIRVSPKRGIDRPESETERERVLSDAELALVWHAGNAFIRMLILTGCRRDEIASLVWQEVHGGAIHLPASRVKTKQSHKIPITLMMHAILEELPHRGRFVMTGTAKAITKGTYKCQVEGISERWVLQDLRRSFASGCQRIGIAPHIVELMLNHRQKGIVRIYQRHKYEPEVIEGFNRWSKHIASITALHPEHMLAFGNNGLMAAHSKSVSS